MKTGGNPTLRRNTIHDGKHAGVLVYDGGLGTLEDNDIIANSVAGVVTSDGGNPTVRRNRIKRNVYVAVCIHEGGQGVFEENDLTGNEQGAWLIDPDPKENVTRARNRE